jgi:hypothetical protein
MKIDNNFSCNTCGISGDDEDVNLFYCENCGEWVCLDCAIKDPDPAGEYLCEKCAPPQSIQFILESD